jgi:hypothetical protein
MVAGDQLQALAALPLGKERAVLFGQDPIASLCTWRKEKIFPLPEIEFRFLSCPIYDTSLYQMNYPDSYIVFERTQDAGHCPEWLSCLL